MKPINRLTYAEEDVTYVLVTEKNSLQKRITIEDNVWQGKTLTPSKFYTYECYYTPDLEHLKDLINHLSKQPNRCIINGKPKRDWPEDEPRQRKKDNITGKKTRFLMLDVDEMITKGWKHSDKAIATYNKVQETLADVNPGFAVQDLGVVVHLTSNWGNPKNKGPRLRIVYQLDQTVTTSQLYAFTKEFLKRQPHLMIDPAIYRPTQIVYTANPYIVPPTAGPACHQPGQWRGMYNKKVATIDWHQLASNYDAEHRELVDRIGPKATVAENKLFTVITDKLAEEGLIRGIEDTRVHITCPWTEEHGSGPGSESSTSVWQKEEGGNPIFKCQHMTCDGRHWRDAVDAWKTEGIITVEELHNAAFEEAKEDFKEEPDTLKHIDVVELPPLKTKATHLMNMQDVKDNYIHDEVNDMLIDRRSGSLMRDKAVSRVISRVNNPFPDPYSVGVYKKVDLTGAEAWTYTDVPNGLKPGLSVSSVIWIPRKEMIDSVLRIRGSTYYNTYKGLATKPKLGNAQLFEDHMRILFPDEDAFQWAMGFFAHIVQRPWEKPSVALLHVSSQKGLGRGLLRSIMQSILGGQETAVNLDVIVDPKTAHNTIVDKKLLISIEEVRMPKRLMNVATERLKTFVTTTDMNINPKNRDERENVPVFYRVFMMSNNLDAIKIDNDDRRFYVYSPPEGHKLASALHYEKVGAMLQNQEAMQAIMDKLMDWKIEVFEPFKEPPMTEFKEQMMRVTEDWIETVARDAMTKYGPNKFGISAEQFKDIIKLTMVDKGLHHFLDELDNEFAIARRKFQNTIPRKSYMGKVNVTLYGKTPDVAQAHSRYTRSELGKKAVEQWDENLKELMLNVK